MASLWRLISASCMPCDEVGVSMGMFHGTCGSLSGWLPYGF